MKKGPSQEGPFFISLARPERLRRVRAVVELPTVWFVGRLGYCRLFQFNNLDGPPSPYVPLNLAKPRRVRIQPYVTALPACLRSTQVSQLPSVEAGIRRSLSCSYRCFDQVRRQDSTKASAARETSSSVVSRPRVRRTVPSASVSATPIARITPGALS